MRQKRFSPFHDYQQVTVMTALTNGLFDQVALEDVSEAEEALSASVMGKIPHVCQKISKGQPL